MRDFNKFDVKGRLHDYKLETAEGKKGTAIRGEIQVETDNSGTLVKVNFYINEMTAAGRVNRTFAELEAIMSGSRKTVVEDGKDAEWISISGDIRVRYFASRSGDEVAKIQELSGRFINDNNRKDYLNKWSLDTLITSVTEVEADPERNIPRSVKVKGYGVNSFFKQLFDVEFQAFSENAINYIAGNLSPSEEMPYFVQIGGEIQRSTRTIVRQNAFGDDETDEYDTYAWAITRMDPAPYDPGDEAALGMGNYAEFLAALAEKKADILQAADKEEDFDF